MHYFPREELIALFNDYKSGDHHVKKKLITYLST